MAGLNRAMILFLQFTNTNFKDDEMNDLLYNFCEKYGYKKNNLRFYLKNYLFKGMDFRNKRILDIGGGDGVNSFFAVISGARAVVLEPGDDGSTLGVQAKFLEMRNYLNLTKDEIELFSTRLQDYESSEKFDIVLLHNSINHIDEEACVDLLERQEARDVYSSIFRKIASLVNVGGVIIVTDCARANFWPSVGLVNPVARSIEWHKHHAPETWSGLLTRAGFVETSISWTSFNTLRWLGRYLLGNKYLNYFLLGHFRLEMRRGMMDR